MSALIRHLFYTLRQYRRPRAQPPRPRPRTTFRPTLERLEARIVPATLTVTTTADSGVGSLRAEVAAASAGDTIVFGPQVAGQTIGLMTGDIQITQANLTIDGGTAGVTIDGDNLSQIFAIGGNNGSNGDTLENLTLIHGLAAGTNGGAITVGNSTSLTLSGVNLSQNSATTLSGVGGNGGAIANYGSLTVKNNSMFGLNSADPRYGDGGAIFSTGGGQLAISSSTLMGNSAGVDGGAIYSTNTINLTSDSLSSNLAQQYGGAVDAEAGTPGTTQLTVSNSSFVSNTAKSNNGGAIYTSDILTVTTSNLMLNDAGGYGGAILYSPYTGNTSITLNQDTITGNTAVLAGGGVTIGRSSDPSGSVVVSVTNSTFASNEATATQSYGGGLEMQITVEGTTSANVTLVNDTFFQNYAGGNAGAIYLQIFNNGTGATTAALTSLTVYQNSSGTSFGGVFIGTPANTVTLDNNIFDGNFGGYNGPLDIVFSNLNVIASEQYNLVGMTDQGFNPQNNHDIQDNTTGLANSLAANGAQPGYPQTLALSTTKTMSPGYETGDPALANRSSPYNIDERGLTRQAGKVSIGAEDPDAQP
jgi:predicted outer membrane repeat protein